MKALNLLMNNKIPIQFIGFYWSYKGVLIFLINCNLLFFYKLLSMPDEIDWITRFKYLYMESAILYLADSSFSLL